MSRCVRIPERTERCRRMLNGDRQWTQYACNSTSRMNSTKHKVLAFLRARVAVNCAIICGFCVFVCVWVQSRSREKINSKQQTPTTLHPPHQPSTMINCSHFADYDNGKRARWQASACAIWQTGKHTHAVYKYGSHAPTYRHFSVLTSASRTIIIIMRLCGAC